VRTGVQVQLQVQQVEEGLVWIDEGVEGVVEFAWRCLWPDLQVAACAAQTVCLVSRVPPALSVAPLLLTPLLPEVSASEDGGADVTQGGALQGPKCLCIYSLSSRSVLSSERKTEERTRSTWSILRAFTRAARAVWVLQAEAASASAAGVTRRSPECDYRSPEEGTHKTPAALRAVLTDSKKP
jgi:hypothetical protein